MKKRHLEIPGVEFLDANFHLKRRLPWPGKMVHTRYLYVVDFGDGIQVDIKVCNGEPPYVDAVLFENGCEVCVAEPSDSLIGEYHLEDSTGKKYLIEAYSIIQKHPQGKLR